MSVDDGAGAKFMRALLEFDYRRGERTPAGLRVGNQKSAGLRVGHVDAEFLQNRRIFRIAAIELHRAVDLIADVG
jgi:hypothetical protein